MLSLSGINIFRRYIHMLKTLEKPLWRLTLLLLVLGFVFCSSSPAGASAVTHQVVSGENLSIIAQRYNTTVTELVSANGISNPSLIYPGQILSIPSGAASGSAPLSSRQGRIYGAGELDLFARLVHSEASGEPYVGQVAVAATILNRVESPSYPNTIAGVIYQVVRDALEGWDPSNGALGFYNPRKTANQWVRRQQVTTVIGNHVFFR
jgi:N-acetylmuramoyl-L-alanine amidase